MTEHEPALITEMSALDLIGRVVTNPNGGEFVVSDLTFNAKAACVSIQLRMLDEDGEMSGDEVGVFRINGWRIGGMYQIDDEEE